VTGITGETRIAAEEAFARLYADRKHTLAECLRAALEAAAPLIAAAERERTIRLASKLRAAFPADEPAGAMASFADYLRVTDLP
jgi:hypothetical protein